MRQQDKVIVWPIYFDYMKTRGEGRRVSKNLGVPSPRALEVKEASERAGLTSEFVPDVGYPKTPWLKTGMVLVKKKDSKGQAIVAIAGQLLKMRRAVQPS